jgi:hypothetical protein
MSQPVPIHALLLLLTVPSPALAAEQGQGWASFGRQGFICVHGRSRPNACRDAITASIRISAEQNRQQPRPRQQPEPVTTDGPSVQVLHPDPADRPRRGRQGNHSDFDLQQMAPALGVLSSPAINRPGDPAAFAAINRTQGPGR